MITKEQVKTGLERGIIRLITDPNLERGTVCAIGDTDDNWFYFSDETAEELTPEEYRRAVPTEEIVDKIYIVLCDFRVDKIFEDKYNLYQSILDKKINKGFDEEQFMQYLENKFRGDEIYILREMIEKVVAYGHKHEQIGKDQFCDWLAETIPCLSFGEAAMFMEDDCLTKHGQEEKAAALEQYLSNDTHS